jgi:DHA1 family tetracycline resistance protein-like MFS transporter
VADVTPGEQRAARFGMLGVAFGAGFVLGPAIGGLTGAIDPRLPFWVAALLGLAVVVLFVLLIDSNAKVPLRQPYPGIFFFFLWGLLLARLQALRVVRP